MAVPGSPPNGSWASLADDAIELIYKANISDPNWHPEFIPWEAQRAMAKVQGWPKSKPQSERQWFTSQAFMLHRKAQKNIPGKWNPYVTRWVVSWNKDRYLITGNRNPGINTQLQQRHRANAMSVPVTTIRDATTRFLSDLLHEVNPTLAEHPVISRVMHQAANLVALPAMEAILDRLRNQALGSIVRWRVAEQERVSFNFAACATHLDLWREFERSMVAAGYSDEEIQDRVERVAAELGL